jgi:hypothetical protein
VCFPLGTPQPQSAEDEKNRQEADGNDSDGIARVYGMNNVQAEELVEYATPQQQDHDQDANGIAGSPPVSRACA